MNLLLGIMLLNKRGYDGVTIGVSVAAVVICVAVLLGAGFVGSLSGRASKTEAQCSGPV